LLTVDAICTAPQLLIWLPARALDRPSCAAAAASPRPASLR
jgi:hypothetical protein